MDLAAQQRDGVAIASLPRIPLDTAFVQEFATELGALIATCPRLVLDLRRLLFIDSSGVGALVSALTTARKAGGDIKLANVPQQVQSVLEVARLDKLFATFPTVDDAVAAYSARK